MKTLYIDCGMGAAGDMLSAALLELLPDREAFVKELNALGIPGVEYKAEPAEKCGITGTHMSVLVHGQEEGHHHHDHEEGHHHEHEHEHDHKHEHEHEHSHDHEHEPHHDHEHQHEHEHHHHSGMADIEHIVRGHLQVSEAVKDKVMQVYQMIAEAESTVHGRPVDQIHFHEVGSMDAVADVTAVCMLMEKIAPDRVVVSPIHVGSGQVKCAHGILPVPAPATAHILKGIPVYGGSIQGELCTPTGAALLKCFADEYGEMPTMIPDGYGYGMGKKDFERANCVRVTLGHTDTRKGEVYELSCNLDDMTAEAMGFAMDKLFEEGALDVYTMPIGMKKQRPATMLNVICTGADREKMAQAIFKYTTTLGIREHSYNRYTLNRNVVTENTQFGPVHKKVSTGYGIQREKYEYDDLSRIATEQGMTLDEVRLSLKK